MNDELATAAKGITPAILSILEQYQRAPSKVRTYLRTCLKWIVREFPARPSKMSVAAGEKARELGFPTLVGVEWRHQPRYDPKRQHLLWEHMLPVSDIVELLLTLEEPTDAAIIGVLDRYQIAWITKQENKKLPTNRRNDPAAVYAAAGIELVDLY